MFTKNYLKNVNFTFLSSNQEAGNMRGMQRTMQIMLVQYTARALTPQYFSKMFVMMTSWVHWKALEAEQRTNMASMAHLMVQTGQTSSVFSPDSYKYSQEEILSQQDLQTYSRWDQFHYYEIKPSLPYKSQTSLHSSHVERTFSQVLPPPDAGAGSWPCHSFSELAAAGLYHQYSLPSHRCLCWRTFPLEDFLLSGMKVYSTNIYK